MTGSAGRRWPWSKPETVEAAPPAPRFVCRTCNSDGPFYAAQQVINWNAISDPYRTPDGTLTYRHLHMYLPGEPGPPLAYLCGNCRARAETLEELVLEPKLRRGGVEADFVGGETNPESWRDA